MNEKEVGEKIESSAKRTWQAPVIEELEVTATEAAYIPGAPNDLGIYTV
jgi:hypothetical protein